MPGEHHEFQVARLNHISKGYTTTSWASNLSFPKDQVQLDQYKERLPNFHDTLSFCWYLQGSSNVINSVALFSDWDKTALNLSLPQGKCHNQQLRTMLQWKPAFRPQSINSSSLNSQGRGSPPHPAATPLLLGAAVPAARTPGWLTRHHLIHQACHPKHRAYQEPSSTHTLGCKLCWFKSQFEAFAAGAASAKAIPSATAHKSSPFSSFKHPLAGPTVRCLGTTTASFQERETKKLKL